MSALRVGFACWIVTSYASALQRPSVVLVYDVDPQVKHCPDERMLRDSVATRLGYDPFNADARVTVHASVRRQGAGLQGVVELVDEHGQRKGRRTIETKRDRCDEIAASMTLVLSIAIDPIMNTGPMPSVVASAAPSPQVAPTSPPTLQPTQPAQPSLPEPWRMQASLGPALTLVGAPSVAPAVELGFGLIRAHASLGIEGRAEFATYTNAPARPSNDPRPAAKVGADVLSVRLVPCLRQSAFGACFLGDLGVLRAASDGLDIERRPVALQAAAGARADAYLVLWRNLRGYAHVAAMASIVRTTLYVGGQEAWTVPAVRLETGTGLAWHFE